MIFTSTKQKKKPMKQCLFDSCKRFVFSNDYCIVHQHLRTDDKWMNRARNKAVEPRSTIQTHKLPTVNKQGLKTTKNELLFSFGYSDQVSMFKDIWNEREHKCALSGVSLDNVQEKYRHWTMAHIIAKGLYPYFKYNKQNILLLHPDVHTMVDNFTEDLREKNKDVNFDYWFELQDKLKQQYKQFLLDNML